MATLVHLGHATGLTPRSDHATAGHADALSCYAAAVKRVWIRTGPSAAVAARPAFWLELGPWYGRFWPLPETVLATECRPHFKPSLLSSPRA